MIKIVTYKKKEYQVEFVWSGNDYAFRVMGVSGFKIIPNYQLGNMDALQYLIADAIDSPSDLEYIQKWDGAIKSNI